MTETKERLMQPTVVRRGAIEVLQRESDGVAALCVFWDEEHAEEATCGIAPASEGWRAQYVDPERLETIFELVGDLDVIYLEAPPGHPDLCGVFEPGVFVKMLLDAIEE